MREFNEPHPGEVRLQEQAGTRLAGSRLIRGMQQSLNPGFRRFIEARDMFFLATSDEEGRLDCSYRGGAPGFVRVVNERTLVFPDYSGNGSFMSLGNLLVNPQIGMLFMDFPTRRRLRVNGRAEILEESPLLAEFPGAERIVRVTVEQAFGNCSRYIHRMVKVEESPDVPTPATTHAA